MADYTGKKTDKLCTTCNEGWLHEYPQDLQGELRCGRCGELDEKTVRARIKTPVDITSGLPEGAVIKTAAKPATTRKGA